MISRTHLIYLIVYSTLLISMHAAKHEGTTFTQRQDNNSNSKGPALGDYLIRQTIAELQGSERQVCGGKFQFGSDSPMGREPVEGISHPPLLFAWLSSHSLFLYN